MKRVWWCMAEGVTHSESCPKKWNAKLIAIVILRDPLITNDNIYFGSMLSFGTICFEDRFCASKKGGKEEVCGF